MTEVEWVESVARQLRKDPWFARHHLAVQTGLKLAYASELRSYDTESQGYTARFATDLALTETLPQGGWVPRVVVEAKLGKITTHDAITYSHKAAIHRSVHPYLRYGVMLGDWKSHPLPGRLYRHGAQFDFMISFRLKRLSEEERRVFTKILRSEVSASRSLESIMYNSRKRNREPYTVLHRRLIVENL